MKNFNRCNSHGHHGSKRRKLAQHVHWDGTTDWFFVNWKVKVTVEQDAKCLESCKLYIYIMNSGLWTWHCGPCIVAGLCPTTCCGYGTGHLNMLYSLCALEDAIPPFSRKEPQLGRCVIQKALSLADAHIPNRMRLELALPCTPHGSSIRNTSPHGAKTSSGLAILLTRMVEPYRASAPQVYKHPN